MSFNGSASAQMMKAKLMRLDRLYKDIAGILLDNPQCLDENPRRQEVLDALEWHLYYKMEKSESNEAKPNLASVIKLSVLVDSYEEEKSAECAWKIFEYLLNASEQELKYVHTPDFSSHRTKD